MTKNGLPSQFEVGVLGLDSYGRKLVRAWTQQPSQVLVYDRHPENVQALRAESPGLSVNIADSMGEFMESLRQHRKIVLSWTDAASDPFGELLGRLQAGDVLIDAGNCHFKDCIRRARCLAERNIRYLEMGIACGGEESRFGPVLMIGGRRDIYQSVRPLLETMAVKEGGYPCVHHVGPEVAGHFVKMIHDAIGFSFRQMVLETVSLLKRALDLGDDDLLKAARAWPIGSIDRIPSCEPVRWASQAARELNVSTPIIDAVAGTRVLSNLEKQNSLASAPHRQPVGHFGDDMESVLAELGGALSAGVVIAYAEGVALLSAGSEQYQFNIDVARVIRLWKGCSNIHVTLLDQMAAAFEAMPRLANLLNDDDLSENVMAQQESLRHAVWRAHLLRLPVPALLAALDYLDFHRGAWLPVNLIDLGPTAALRPAWLNGAPVDLNGWDGASGGDPLRPLSTTHQK